jgi:hypothetical protein
MSFEIRNCAKWKFVCDVCGSTKTGETDGPGEVVDCSFETMEVRFTRTAYSPCSVTLLTKVVCSDCLSKPFTIEVDPRVAKEKPISEWIGK